MPPAKSTRSKSPAPTPTRVTRRSATPADKQKLAKDEDNRKKEFTAAKEDKKKPKAFTPFRILRLALVGIAACMLGPCISHAMDIGHLSNRVSDLGWPFTLQPTLWAALVCATETAGTLLIVTNILPRLGACILLPKMLVAVYGHALVPGFDAMFAKSYASAFTPPGLSYNWSVGASWDCGIFGAGYYLVAYVLLALLK